MLLRLLSIALVAFALAGCGEDGGGAAVSGIEVVATTTQVADLARNVAGDRAAVTGLLAPNADPHDYEVRPRDVEAVAEARLVLRSGGEVDEWLQGAIDGSGTEAPVVSLIDRVRTIEGGHAEHDHAHEEDAPADDDVDPHWWQDPRNAARAVAAIRDALVRADPAGAGDYRANARAYLTELTRLDRAVEQCLERVPEAERKLVTTHDSLGYYASRYGIEVIGTVIPSLSTEGQPSAGATADLVRTIRDEDVKAIFAESSVDPKVEEAIARESGARVGTPLSADALAPGQTYVQSIAANTRALVDGFTGGEQSCSLPF